MTTEKHQTFCSYTKHKEKKSLFDKTHCFPLPSCGKNVPRLRLLRYPLLASYARTSSKHASCMGHANTYEGTVNISSSRPIQ